MVILPVVGRSERRNSRKREVLPAPDGPVRKWKDPGAIENERSLNTSGSFPYRRPTFSNRINGGTLSNQTLVIITAVTFLRAYSCASCLGTINVIGLHFLA